MTEPIITCPNCQTEIKLNESLAAPLVEATKRLYEQRLEKLEREITGREHALLDEKRALAEAQATLDEQLENRLRAERAVIAAEESKKAKAALTHDLEAKDSQLKELQDLLDTRSAKLKEAQEAQAELLRKERDLQDQKRELALTIEKRVQESLDEVRGQARKEAEEGLALKVREKELTIASMQRQIEELKRRAEQGSQQLQGEVQELALEALLREHFPRDLVEPVAKGELGADALHRVLGPLGQACGTILWESKRTKNWSDGWLAKLREDQRSAKADLAVIVSQALPKTVETFGLLDGVWVTSPRCAMPLALALRQSLVEVASARAAGEGQQTKMEQMYQYLTGPRFRHRVQAIVEKFTDMHEDLDRERKAMTRLWAKREEQIRGVVAATAGMYGDLQGIAGKTLQEVEGLEMPLLGDGASELGGG